MMNTMGTSTRSCCNYCSGRNGYRTQGSRLLRPMSDGPLLAQYI